MKLRHSLLIAGAIAAVAVIPALADVTYTQGSGTTIFDFTCFTTKHCSAHVPVNSAGTEIGTASTPFQVSVISGTVSLPTGAATSANQTTELASLATIASNSSLPLPTQAVTVAVGGVGIMDANGTTAINDPCATGTKVYTPINMVTATNKIIAGVSAKLKYICHVMLYPGAADNFAIYQATTGTSCATAQTDIFGGHTTATGFIATAQAGFVAGAGNSSIAATTTVNTDICLTTGSAVQLSGVIVTVDR